MSSNGTARVIKYLHAQILMLDENGVILAYLSAHIHKFDGLRRDSDLDLLQPLCSTLSLSVGKKEGGGGQIAHLHSMIAF